MTDTPEKKNKPRARIEVTTGESAWVAFNAKGRSLGVFSDDNLPMETAFVSEVFPTEEVSQ